MGWTLRETKWADTCSAGHWTILSSCEQFNSREYYLAQVHNSTAGATEEGCTRQPPAWPEALPGYCPCGQCSREPLQPTACAARLRGSMRAGERGAQRGSAGKVQEMPDVLLTFGAMCKRQSLLQQRLFHDVVKL